MMASVTGSWGCLWGLMTELRKEKWKSVHKKMKMATDTFSKRLPLALWDSEGR